MRYQQKFNDFFNQVERNKVYIISQQRNAAPFQISVVKKDEKYGFHVDRVLRSNSFLDKDIFLFVIKELENAKNRTLTRGNARGKGHIIGHKNLGEYSIEALVAIKFFGKKKGQIVFMRISAISNILVASGVCIHGVGTLSLNPNL